MANQERRHSFDRRHGDRRQYSADRRRFIQVGAAAAAVVAIPSRLKALSPPAPVAPAAVAAAPKAAPALALRELAFVHTHTAEKMAIAYAVNGQYQAAALSKLNHLLRDFRTGEKKPIDPKLFDLLHELTQALGNEAPFHVISGYRSPHTNSMLRKTGGGGVATTSLHMVGKAIDIRVPDVKLKMLREAAADLKRGGVGFYPSSNFVHVDTGRVRYW